MLKSQTALNQQLGQITAQVNAQLGQVTQQLQKSTGDLNARLDNAARVVQEVSKGLGSLSEATQKVFLVGKDIASLQEILRAPKLRGGARRALSRRPAGPDIPPGALHAAAPVQERRGRGRGHQNRTEPRAGGRQVPPRKLQTHR